MSRPAASTPCTSSLRRAVDAFEEVLSPTDEVSSGSTDSDGFAAVSLRESRYVDSHDGFATRVVAVHSEHVDSDGFATVVVSDIAQTVQFEADQSADEEEEDEEEEDEPALAVDEEFELQPALASPDAPAPAEDEEFGGWATKPTQSISQQPQLGGEDGEDVEEESSSSSEEDDGSDDGAVEVTVEHTVQTAPASSSRPSARADFAAAANAFTPAFAGMAGRAQHGGAVMSSALAFSHSAAPASSSSSSSSCTMTPAQITASESEFHLLREMLSQDMDASLARLRARAAQQARELEEQESWKQDVSGVDVEDLSELMPRRDRTVAQPPPRIPAAPSVIAVPVTAVAPVSDERQQALNHQAEEDQDNDAFLEQAAMMAAEMSDSEESESSESPPVRRGPAPSARSTITAASQRHRSSSKKEEAEVVVDGVQEAFSSIGFAPAAAPAASAPAVVSPSSARASRYTADSSASSSAASSAPASGSSTATAASTSVLSAGLQATIARAATSASTTEAAPSFQEARHGWRMAAGSSTQSSSAQASGARPHPAPRNDIAVVAPTAREDAGPSLFTSPALSFLRLTPSRARGLHAAFAREQATFAAHHEGSVEPADVEEYLIQPVGKDELEPSQFRS